MIVSDTLVLDGLLSSNGGAGVKHPSYSFSSGGGSGGSIWVESSQISGSGSITARGGSATSTSYMGGGGRSDRSSHSQFDLFGFDVGFRRHRLQLSRCIWDDLFEHFIDLSSLVDIG